MVENHTLPTSNTDSMQTSTSIISFANCPLTALSKQTLRKLSNFLNAKKLFHTDEGHERDWRGLATLAEQRSSIDENALSGDDPTAKVIQLWCANNADTATFENLENFLGIIDRWHVIDDIEVNLLQDLKDYQIKQQQEIKDRNIKNINSPVSSNDISTNNTFNIPTPPSTPCDENITFSNDHQPNCIINNTLAYLPPATPTSTLNDYVVTSSSTYGSDSNFLTCEDVKRAKQGLPLQHYDALILYADADYEYAREILVKLQTNFEFCLKEHLLYGIQFEHDALMELIRERCTFLIVILTNEFNKSPENRFFLNYAQFLQIQTARRKILPLRYEMNVEIPANLGMYTGMAYNPKRTQIFWDKLENSLECAKITTQGEVTYSHSVNVASLPSAPLFFDEFRQPPYNPQYKLKYYDSQDSATETMLSSSSSSANDRNLAYGRKASIPCELSQSMQSNLYPNTSELSNNYTRTSATTTSEVMMTSSSKANSNQNHCEAEMYNTQPDVYPNISESLLSDHRNLASNSKEITKTSSNNNTQTEEQATSTSDKKKRKNDKGASKFFQKLFKKL